MNPTADIAFEPVAGAALMVRLSGHYTFGTQLPPDEVLTSQLTPSLNRLQIEDGGLAAWDSALLTLLLRWSRLCVSRGLELDLSALPEGVRNLLRLAAEVPEREGSRRTGSKESLVSRIGSQSIQLGTAVASMLEFLGNTTVSMGRMLTGRARYRPAELWLTIQQCGPQALGIVTIISVLVGSILAFVGAVQLKMFGAEVYVANLVGLGMVIEMGALMTGIILAGRTGAAFAAQIGTMQVNEEIDALKTMGIPPMDYLVMPRMTALALMTPLLVAYADILGILGGAAVGIFLLKIPPVLFFNQAFQTMTLWHCGQGLIKGATFGVLVAFAGCWRGMQCGRSASAVGEAATSAVVTGIVMIVVADTIWTLIFMVTG